MRTSHGSQPVVAKAVAVANPAAPAVAPTTAVQGPSVRCSGATSVPAPSVTPARSPVTATPP